jgi:hypothetical protein
MDKLENTRSRVRCICSMCQSFWPLILKQTVILTAMSNYFPSYMQIIGQWPTPNGNVFCVKYDRELDLGFWEILKPLKWTNITSFFLIKTNGWKDLLKLLFLCEFKCKKKIYKMFISTYTTGFQRSPSLSKKKVKLKWK